MMTARALLCSCILLATMIGCSKKEEDAAPEPKTEPTAVIDAAAAAQAIDAAPTPAAIDAAAGESTDAAAAGDSDAATPADQGPGDKADPNKPKDLQILPKSWSRKQVNDYMKKQITRGLGVKCSYCHVGKDYAANTKNQKEIARDMIKMQNGINKRDFGGKGTVTCFTCHKGAAKIKN